ncbi:MAG: HAMP domain-containing histidine kinase [Clostridia bacterium]|nr:HAMP domain-containing histidine kinase [Clostridia bacterium]
MKSHYTFFKKASAVILSALCFLLVAVSLVGIVFAAEYDFYTSTRGQLRHDAIRSLLTTEAHEAYDKYISGNDPVGYYEETNFRFLITDENGNELASNYTGEYAMESCTLSITVTTDETATVCHTLTAYMIDGGADIFRGHLALLDFLFAMRFILIAIAAFFSLVLAALWIYLICAAGRSPESTEAKCGIPEKIPFDLYTMIYAIVAICMIWIFDALQYAVPEVLFLILVAFAVFVAHLLMLSFVISVAVRIKTGTILKYTAVYIVCSFLFRKLRALLRLIPFVWKTLILVALYFLFDAFIFFIGLHESFFMIAFIKNMLCIPIVLYVAYVFRRLKTGAQIIENGDFRHHIETDGMIGDFKTMGESLNNIAGGLNVAVEERIRSERMKTELITNVSHDIKTPLTSIINYADLLKKEEIGNETARGYVEVIDRQATRLKKLITDLVEASKASTGNIQVNPEPCDIGVLLQQAAGEYDEKLRRASLTPIFRTPDEPLTILADGRLLWRVFDNLLGNICKYSLEGTRVYLDAAAYGDICIISFKNISRTELNVSVEELTERFVRADSSRSTEGNGLGLSIAQSLVELQGGKLRITADGDLFKVDIQFPLLTSDAEEATK